MTTLRRILVPILDTNAATFSAAMSKAMQLALATGATIELFHALRPPLHGVAAAYPDSTSLLMARERAAAMRQLEAAAARCRQAGIKAQVSIAADYPAFEAIIRHAMHAKAGLIVLDGHVRHRLAGILQLTDWELLRNCPVPVLIVRRRERYMRPAILAAVDPTHRHEKTAGLDQAILATAARLAGYLGGELHVVHAVPPPVPFDPYGVLDDKFLVDVRVKAHDAAAKKLERALSRSRTKPRKVHIVDGQPRAAIAEVARSVRARIVVMGVMSRSRLSRLLIGSTAEVTLDAIDCDVLVIKPRGFRSPVPARARAGVQPILDRYILL